MSSIVLWSLFGYLLGAIPFAYLLGRIFVKQDIRRVGDGNPGGTNTWKAGGWRIGLAAILLEIFKGFLPVALARQCGISEGSLIPISLSPILGHATMPFLGFRGGKALGVTGGVWVGLLGVPAFAVYFGTLALLVILRENAWAAVFGVSLFFIWTIFLDDALWMTILAILNILVILWTHRRELKTQPHLRPWLTNLFVRKGR
ncbi:MAG TPA: glycerol-3-phosphate acyltransferase [Anaerolineales bacterium]|nr:glycerol-3-phosphate acyltransferase [Anaerolineales bacterium]